MSSLAEAIPLLAWRVGPRFTKWHAEAEGDRWATRCGLALPAGARVSRRQVTPAHWPDMCDACRLQLLKRPHL